MRDYAFLTRWRFQAPIGAVWDLVAGPEAWPSWWRGVEKVELLEAGDAEGRGALRRFTWKSKLPYRLAFDMRAERIEKPSLLEGRAQGELEGEGRWELREEAEGWTAVDYHWRVRTTKAWMNALYPLLKPAFAWNHDAVMRWGGEGLAKRLGCAWEDRSHA